MIGNLIHWCWRATELGVALAALLFVILIIATVADIGINGPDRDRRR